MDKHNKKLMAGDSWYKNLFVKKYTEPCLKNLL